jgi:hypothetical protein
VTTVCYICQREVWLVPDVVAPGARAAHRSCAGAMPTLVELITAFVFTVPGEAFCTNCLASKIGVTRTDVEDGLAQLDGMIVSRQDGTCARCRARGRVVLAGERPTVDENPEPLPERA